MNVEILVLLKTFLTWPRTNVLYLNFILNACAILEPFTALITKIDVYWDVMPCSLVEIHLRYTFGLSALYV